MNIKEEIYLSPEQLDGVRLKKPNIRYDKERSEVFTLGLCLIYAITLEDLRDIVNRNTLEVDMIFDLDVISSTSCCGLEYS